MREKSAVMIVRVGDKDARRVTTVAEGDIETAGVHEFRVKDVMLMRPLWGAADLPHPGVPTVGVVPAAHVKNARDGLQ